MSEETFQITPIGAAYVDALPDRKKAKAIHRRFLKARICPSSPLFNEADVVKFYADRGQKVAAFCCGIKVG